MGMGRVFLLELDQHRPRLACLSCWTAAARYETSLAHNPEKLGFSNIRKHATDTHDTQLTIVFPKVVNVNVPEGRVETRFIDGNSTTVSEAFCTNCGDLLGWRIEQQTGAYPPGSFALDRNKVQQRPAIPVVNEPAAADEDEPAGGEEDGSAGEGNEW